MKDSLYTDTWPTDGRNDGVPDPSSSGPEFIQIGKEGGFMPAPAVLPNTPIGYVYNRRDISVLNVSTKTLFLWPAERADVIVDFSQVPDGATIILYNDSPDPVPGFDPRFDYYSGNPDLTDSGGAPTTIPGYGPIQNIVVTDGGNGYTSLPDITLVGGGGSGAQAQAESFTFTMYPKSIVEEFDLIYGRMNAMLGVEIPNTYLAGQVTIPYFDIDPPTEILKINPIATYKVEDEYVQIWNISHNGVDTHTMHWHLFNLQLVNRVGWDGMISPPDPNELWWKELVRMNPLTNTIVAIRPIKPVVPFGLIDSFRPMDVTMPVGSTIGFTNVDPNNEPAPDSPINIVASPVAIGKFVQWTDNSYNETAFTVQRANSPSGPFDDIVTLASQTSEQVGNIIGYVDTDVSHGKTYYYRIVANNTVGYTQAYPPPAIGYPQVTSDSVPSSVAKVNYGL